MADVLSSIAKVFDTIDWQHSPQNSEVAYIALILVLSEILSVIPEKPLHPKLACSILDAVRASSFGDRLIKGTGTEQEALLIAFNVLAKAGLPTTEGLPGMLAELRTMAKGEKHK